MGMVKKMGKKASILFNGGLLGKVNRPSRYLGSEFNAVFKSPDQVKVHLVLAFPDLYEVGMSHLGTKILYALANSLPYVYAERVFAPAADMEALLREKDIPLFSLESRTPLSRFDLVGFTLQYELNYTSILNMLHLGGIPMRGEERKQQHPLVIGGGPLALNPEPLAPFLDLFVLGDGEEVLLELLQLYRDWKESGARKEEFLAGAAGIAGVYVPSFYIPRYRGGRFVSLERKEEHAPAIVERRIVSDLDSAFYPRSFIVPYLDIVHDRAILELFRGCPQGCRFCQAGFVYRPMRERSPERLKELAVCIMESTGYEELSLSSLSSSDYSGIEELITLLEEEFAGKQVRLSLPSLKADPFAVKLAARIQGGISGGITFAPEAGTQRLRDIINKRATEDDILSAACDAIEAGRNHLKLYFMLGLPGEKEEDLAGIVELCSRIAAAGRKRSGRGRPLRTTVSVSTFVPKAHTPFQWEPQLDLTEVRRRQEYLRRQFQSLKNVQLTWHQPGMSYLEAVFARGDRRLAAVLEEAHARGSRLDAWSDHFDFQLWEKAFHERGIDPHWYARSSPGYGEPLPWEHLQAGVTRDFLACEHKLAMKGEVTPDCREAQCAGCGLKKCPLAGR